MSESVRETETDNQGDLRDLRNEITRFMMSYKFAIDEVMTKVNILKEEFASIHEYSPIEHVNSRLKSPENILAKAGRKGCRLDLDDIREQIQDIAGVRITCSFITDTYRIRDMLMNQTDITVLEVKDYIAEPKENGYQSLHLIVAVPVFMSDRVQKVTVEVQIPTIAMDFWASLEHKIYYKYDGTVPPELLIDLKQAADAAGRLDVQMERLHDQVVALGAERTTDDEAQRIRGLPHLPLSSELLAAFARGGAGRA
ncbi:GTP pyrophosphokinase [Glaciibacter superstes]|uniref:GTP pyrophosphokinase n=1 Tax=Glaciibacter superstes TaxID=501023 RepID=UPI0003B5F605|nr:GTP pyrophosphokinase family protein [Glaciibacter superstes]